MLNNFMVTYGVVAHGVVGPYPPDDAAHHYPDDSPQSVASYLEPSMKGNNTLLHECSICETQEWVTSFGTSTRSKTSLYKIHLLLRQYLYL
jgi:hypothetical protein